MPAPAADVSARGDAPTGYRDITATIERPADAAEVAAKEVKATEAAKAAEKLRAEARAPTEAAAKAAAEAAAKAAAEAAARAAAEAAARAAAEAAADAAARAAARVVAKDAGASAAEAAARAAAKAAAKVAAEVATEAEIAVKAAAEAADKAEAVAKTAAAEAAKFEASAAKAEAAAEAARAEVAAAKGPVRGARIYIDGRYVGKTPLPGYPVGIGQKTIRAELLGYIPDTKPLYVEAGTLENLRLELKEDEGKGKLRVVNSTGEAATVDNTVVLDDGSPVTGSFDIELEAGAYTIKTATHNIGLKVSVCKDYPLEVHISDAGIKAINPLREDCRGVWPIATHDLCPTGDPANLRYFQACAFGIPWGGRREDIIGRFGRPDDERARWLAYSHPEKEYSIFYYVDVDLGLTRAKVSGKGVPIVGKIESGVTTYGELVREFRKFVRQLGKTEATDLQFHQAPRRCGKGVSFKLGRFLFATACAPPSLAGGRCGVPFEPYICRDWLVKRQ